MTKTWMHSVPTAAAVAFAVLAAHGPAAQADATPAVAGNATGFVAGTTPDRRPEGAPRIAKFEKPAGWDAKARTGVLEPYPPSLNFLEHQGGWFNPFIHPGMTGPYDLRGWHAKDAKAASTR